MYPPPLKAFLWRLKNVEYTRQRMDDLFDKKHIMLRDIDSVYEALFLRMVTSFEAFLQELFIGIMNRKIKYSRARVSLRIMATSSDALMDILLQGGKYMDWLPFHNTENRAKIYLKNGRPFTDIDDAGKSMIKTITTIRHAIAHKSPHAMKEFEQKVVGSMLLLPREKTPAGFLRSRVHTHPVTNRFQVYIGELERLARAIC